MPDLIQYLDTIKEVVKKGKNQDKAIQVLRNLDFEFVNLYTIQKNKLNLNVRKEDERYQFMIRKLQDPEKKFNTNVAFGFKVFGELENTIVVYLMGNFIDELPMEWDKSHYINFKKVHISKKFPKEMSYKERQEWRIEDAKLEKNPTLEASDFYTKWKPKIKLLIK